MTNKIDIYNLPEEIKAFKIITRVEYTIQALEYEGFSLQANNDLMQILKAIESHYYHDRNLQLRYGIEKHRENEVICILFTEDEERVRQINKQLRAYNSYNLIEIKMNHKQESFITRLFYLIDLLMKNESKGDDYNIRNISNKRIEFYQLNREGSIEITDNGKYHIVLTKDEKTLVDGEYSRRTVMKGVIDFFQTVK